MAHSLLLADDSPTIRRVVELAFADEDVTVATVGDGRRAIDWVRLLHPDIVLADVGMAAPNGYDVAAFIKGTPALAHIPVILLTAAFQPIDEARARDAGCDAVLAKPFELTSLVSRVKELLRGREGAPEGQASAALAPRALAPPASAPPALALPGHTVNDAAANDPTLEDRFDAVDAAGGAPAVEEARATEAPFDGATWTTETNDNRVSLADYFDQVDQCVRDGAATVFAAGVNDDDATTDGQEPADAAASSAPTAPITEVFLALLRAPADASPRDAQRTVRALLTPKQA